MLNLRIQTAVDGGKNTPAIPVSVGSSKTKVKFELSLVAISMRIKFPEVKLLDVKLLDEIDFKEKYVLCSKTKNYLLVFI